MATVPSPRTWSVSDLETAALFNANIRDIQNFLLGGAAGRKPTFFAYQNAATTVATGVETTVPCQVVQLDTDSGYNTTTGVYTIATPGLWVFTTTIAWANNGTGNRASKLVQSTGFRAYTWVPASIIGTGITTTTTLMNCAVGQTVQAQGLQTSGGNLGTSGNSDCYFTGTWLSA